MKSHDRFARVRRIALATLVISFVAGASGCASGPGGSRSASTPYKGDAVWNISSDRPREGAGLRAG